MLKCIEINSVALSKTGAGWAAKSAGVDRGRPYLMLRKKSKLT